MSGDADFYKLTNFLELKQQNGASVPKKSLFLGMSVNEIYTMLESTSPCFLKRDVSRYTTPNNIFTGSLRNPPDAKLLRLEMAQVHVFPHSRRRISQLQKVQRIRLAKKRTWFQIFHLTRPRTLLGPF